MQNTINRRDFIAKGSMAALLLAPVSKALAASLKAGSDPTKICVFSKCLHWLNYNDMATLVAGLGFDGIDLTVRPAGHVLPERVATDLPRAVAAAERAGLKVYMITTAINSADEKYTEDILRTAHSVGIKYYRTAWYNYNTAIDVPANLDIFKTRLNGLAELNRKYQMWGMYQNHAGNLFGASIWDLWLAIKDIDPKYISCQYDIRHATVEAFDNWETGLNLIKNHVTAPAIKDFTWSQVSNKLQAQSVPLGQGLVDYTKYLHLLKRYGVGGPFTMHFEYPLGGAEDGANKLTIPVEQFKASLKNDLVKFKQMLSAYYR